MIQRSKELVELLSNADISYRAKNIETVDLKEKLDNETSTDTRDNKELQALRMLAQKLDEADVTAMTPMDAMNLLYQLQTELRKNR